MKKVQLNVEVAPSVKKRAERLARREDLNLRQFISKLIKEAK